MMAAASPARRMVLAVLILGMAVRCGAVWVTLSVPNGDFSQAGSGTGTFSGTSIQTDGGRILAGWQACGLTYGGSYCYWTGTEAAISGDQATVGKYTRGYWIHDPIPGHTIRPCVYRLTCDLRLTGNYHYKAYCGFLYGDTVPGNGSTWWCSYANGGEGACWTLEHDFYTGTLPLTLTSYRVIWDNTGNTVQPPDGPTGPYGDYDYWDCNNTNAPVRIGEKLRVGFADLLYAAGGTGKFYVDNVVVEYWEPLTSGFTVVVH